MFNTNKKQYLNILQQSKQLRINYKIIQDDKILKEEQSSFLTPEDTIPKDAIFKINTLQKNIDKTYITTLIEDSSQKVIQTKDISRKEENFVQIGNYHNIVMSKKDINALERYYKETGIDFILSPYTILEEYLIDNAKKNSLNFLIYNNVIYSLIYNSKKEISFSKTKSLTPFESTQDESFLEDDIVGQKLYEEVNFLEIQQFLNELVEEYYKSGEDVEFLEHIEMIYTLKPMSDEQIVLLQEELLMPISYRAISIDAYIDEIIQSINPNRHNFITPRIKKDDKSIYTWLGLAIFTTLLAVFFFFFTEKSDEEIINEENKKEIIVQKKEKKVEIKPVKPSIITLPDHKQKNTARLQKIHMLFDVIPYDAILKDIEINQNDSTYIANFIVTSDSLLDMQTKLKNIYVNSTVLLKKQNKVLTNTIIKNETLLEEYNFDVGSKNATYQKHTFLTQLKAEEYLKSIASQNSTITFKEKSEEKFSTYNFSVISKVQSPQEFTDFVNKINSQKFSIEIDYPIVFSKTTNFIEIKYNINIHQQNK